MWFAMQREDLIGGLGAIGSALVAFLGYLWSVGFVQLTFSFLTGAFSTYVVQHRLLVESEKRKIAREHAILMREKIYGPLLRVFTEFLRLTEDAEDPAYSSFPDTPISAFADIMNDYLYLLADEKLRNSVSKIHSELPGYSKLHLSARNAVEEIADSELKKAYPELRIRSSELTFRLQDHGVMVKAFNFEEAALKKTNPIDLFRKEMTELEKPEIEVYGSGARLEDLTKIGAVVEQIVKLAWKESRLIEYDLRRTKLVNDMKEVIIKLKKKIVR